VLTIAQNRLIRERFAAQPKEEIEDSETGEEEKVLCCVVRRVRIQLARDADCVHAWDVFALQAANAGARVDGIDNIVDIDPVPRMSVLIGERSHWSLFETKELASPENASDLRSR